jgi:glycine/D-amino acid oxidase-like deaminating enzyme
VTATPDQLQYSVTLHTDASIELSEAVARLSGTGITAADLSYVSSADTSLNWTFNSVTPFSKMSEMNTTLTQLRTKLGRFQLAPAMDFRVNGMQVSTSATSQACPLAALVSDARKEAERIATAAAVHVGAIVSLSEGTVPTLVQRSGDFSFSAVMVTGNPYSPVIFDPAAGIPLYGVLSQWFDPTPPSTACSLIVQFRIVP